MPKKHRCKQTATSHQPSRGARFFLEEVKQGRLTVAQLIDVKKQSETNSQFVQALGMEVARAFGGVAPQGVTSDAIQAYYGDVCEAIALLTSSNQ